ncbi:MAG: hypothetical protein NC905_04865 [Candidatus Omnitrophica bacterium]|nr:hypothetical protein [Candidatus Omnitrophota bacterium]
MKKGKWVYLLCLFFTRIVTGENIFTVDGEGFIKNWLICGPFPCEYKSGKGINFDTDFLKDIGGEESVEPYPGLEVKVVFPEVPPVERPFVGEENVWGFKEDKVFINQWKVYHSEDYKIDLAKQGFPVSEHILTYAGCYIISKEDKEIKIKLGSDDGYKLWLNGEYLGGWDICRSSVKDQNVHFGVLKKGMNFLLLKISNNLSGYDFCVRITDLKDEPIKDISIYTDNPKRRYETLCKGIGKIDYFSEPYFVAIDTGREQMFTGESDITIKLGATESQRTKLKVAIISPKGKLLISDTKDVALRPDESVNFTYKVNLSEMGDYTIYLLFDKHNIDIEKKIKVISPDYVKQMIEELEIRLKEKEGKLKVETEKLSLLKGEKDTLKDEIKKVEEEANKRRGEFLEEKREAAKKLYKAPKDNRYIQSKEVRTRIYLNGMWEAVSVEEKTDFPPNDGWKPFPVPVVNNPDPAYGYVANDGKWAFHPEIDIDIFKSHKRWYRLYFAVPENLRGKRLFLKFGAINLYAVCYINGKDMGEYYGPYFPWEIDITEIVKYGDKNELLVYVKSPRVTANFKDYVIGDRFLYCIGIWDDVYLETRGDIYTKNVMIAPSVKEWKLATRTFIKNTTSSTKKINIVQQAVRKGKVEFEMVSSLEINPGEERYVDNFGYWYNPVLWGIGGEYGNPELYTLSTKIIEGGKVLDERFDRFGFREFWTEEFNFYLNGKKIYLQGTNALCETEIYNSVTNNPEWIRRLYRILKENNMNIYRLHLHIYPSLFYEIADEMGMLLVAETPLKNYHDKENWKKHPPVWEENVKKHYERWLYELINHPSVVIWSLDNEVCTQSSDDYDRDAGKSRMAKMKEFGQYFKSLWPGNQIYEYNGDVFAWTDPDEPVADIHYPEHGETKKFGFNMEQWQSFFKKPVILGETAYYWIIGYPKKLGHYPPIIAREASMTKQVFERWVELEIPGFIGWWHNGAGYEKTPGKGGPWDADSKGAPSFVSVIWPSLSGRGGRVTRISVGKKYLINWFDEARPEYVDNAINDVFKKVLRPVPPAPSTFPPQVITEVILESIPYKRKYIYLKPISEIPWYVEGILSDEEGKTWFLLPEEGKYELFIYEDGKYLSKDIEIKRIPNDSKPGYKGFNWIKWEVKR